MGSMELWVGRSGTGKSSRVLEEIAQLTDEDAFGAPIWWVVPASAAYSAERRLLERLPATVRAEVIHLRRLAQRAAADVGFPATAFDGTPVQALNRTGKRLHMADVYAKLAPGFNFLKRKTPSMAFMDELLRECDELGSFQVSSDLTYPPSTDQRIDGLSPGFRAALISAKAKLHELLMLDSVYKQTLADRNLYDPDNLYTDLIAELPNWDLLGSAVLYFDGFSSFTPREITFISQLAMYCRRCVVTLPMDPKWLRNHSSGSDVAREEYFAPQSLRTAHLLDRECEQWSIQLTIHEMECDTEHSRFRSAPALAHLESNLYSFSSNPFNSREESRQLVLATAQNPRTEAMSVALEVQRIAQDEGVSYQNIGIVVPQLDEYMDDLSESLDSVGIPYMIDSVPVFAHHPLARFVLAALDCVDTGFTQSAVRRLLKSEFPGISRNDADWLEEYVRTYEIGDREWVRGAPWTFAQDSVDSEAIRARKSGEDSRAEHLRNRFYSVFRPFSESLRTPLLSASSVANQVWSLLGTVGAKRILAQWTLNEDASLSPLEASLHEQAWGFLVDWLDDFAVAPQIGELPRTMLFELIRTSFSEYRLSTIPGGIDSVLVTDTDHAHGCECEVVFALGCSDGVYPQRIQPSGLFLDEEREAIAHVHNIVLGPTTEMRQKDERYVIYTVLTRARRQLWVSYPLSGRDGRAKRPAVFIERIKRLFGHAGLEECLWTLDFSVSSDMLSRNPEAASIWLRKYWRGELKLDGHQHKTLMDTVTRWLSQDAKQRQRMSLVKRGAKHKAVARNLNHSLAGNLFHGPVSVNVSQLETFAACPFQHFVRYGLRVSEEDGANRLNANRGTLIHEVVNEFVKDHMTDIKSWQSISDDEAMRVMHQVMDEVLARPKFSMWGRRAAYMRIAEGARRVLEHAALVLTEHARHSVFQPRFLEFTFDDLVAFDDELGLQLQDGTRLHIKGRIDRIDVAAHEGRHAFRIIDYKSSQLSLDLSRVMYGLQLQLPVYVAMVQRMASDVLGQESEPAGILYIPLMRKVTAVKTPSDGKSALRATLGQMRARGWLVEDTQLISWMDNRLTSDGDTRLFSNVYNKDGTLSKRAPVLSKQAWNALLHHALEQVTGIAQLIAEGDIGIRPYRFDSTDSACHHCHYRPICHVDPRWDASPFRRLERPRDSTQQLLERAQGGHNHG